MKLPPAIAALLVTAACAADEPFRYRVEVLSEELSQPMHLRFAPDGRLYLSELGGAVKRYDPADGSLRELGRLEVFTEQESGLQAMALDPAFADNHWIYLLSSTTDFDGQRLERYTVDGDRLDPASRRVLLRVPEQRERCCHHGGSMDFAPDGLLYLSTGDNTDPLSSDGFSPLDERPGRSAWDAQKSSGNSNDLRGKLLRIRPTPDGGYDIPAGNLFPPGTANTRAEIYAMGFRNPWRFSIDPASGAVFLADIGPDARRDDPARGPAGSDTLHRIDRPGNFGWPFARDGKPYHRHDFGRRESGAAFSLEAPRNTSPNNDGLEVLPPVEPPLLSYSPGPSEHFPLLGQGGRSACAGPVFRYREEFAAGHGFPASRDGALLFFDWQRPFLVWLVPGDDGSPPVLKPFPPVVELARGPQDPAGPLKLRRPVDMRFGPDGALYVLDYGETWGANPDARLLRISYHRGNLPPEPVATVTPDAGGVPLELRLSAAGSSDPEGGALSHRWTLEPGGRTLGEGERITARLEEPGSFRVRLTSRDPEGGTAETSRPVVVGNRRPQLTALAPADGSFFTPGGTLRYAFRVDDPEDGSSDDAPELAGFRTLVSARFTTRDGGHGVEEPGLASIKVSDCFNCHAVDQQMVGPSFLAIADRYRDDPATRPLLVQRIHDGSTGVWGDLAMLPHPQHNMDEIDQMVGWILGLDASRAAGGLQRGLSGEFTVPDDPRIVACTLEATHTDAGNPPAGPLAATATIRLRPRRVEAESAAALAGPRVLELAGASRRRALGAIAPGHHAGFGRVALDQVSRITLRAANGGPPAVVELRDGGPQGDPIGRVEVTDTGGWGQWREFEFPVPEHAGSVDLTLVFLPADEPRGPLLDLDWLHFHP